MICPKCNSENVQKLSVIYQSGTHNINTQSNTAGGGYMFGNGGGFFTTASTTETSGKQQSMLAEMATPPKKHSYIPCVVFLVVGSLFIYTNEGWWLVGVFFVMASFIWTYLAYEYNTRQWPKKYRNWSASWHCNRCGELYVA